jgi:hypothetical protein
MTGTETPALAGGDAANGRFAWHHADCGTIYADTLDEAIAAAHTRLDAIDPVTASQKCVNVQRAGFNTTPKDWKPA